jgi:hypothetical protein
MSEELEDSSIILVWVERLWRFKKKYDSRVTWELLKENVYGGYLIHSVLISIQFDWPDTIFRQHWSDRIYLTKFKPIIMSIENRFGPRGYQNFEYLAEEMFKRRRQMEASVSDRLVQVTSEHSTIK